VVAVSMHASLLKKYMVEPKENFVSGCVCSSHGAGGYNSHGEEA
jgi:hypothetical protein